MIKTNQILGKDLVERISVLSTVHHVRQYIKKKLSVLPANKRSEYLKFLEDEEADMVERLKLQEGN